MRPKNQNCGDPRPAPEPRPNRFVITCAEPSTVSRKIKRKLTPFTIPEQAANGIPLFRVPCEKWESPIRGNSGIVPVYWPRRGGTRLADSYVLCKRWESQGQPSQLFFARAPDSRPFLGCSLDANLGLVISTSASRRARPNRQLRGLARPSIVVTRRLHSLRIGG